MWLHALDISYEGALAPHEREGVKGGSRGGRGRERTLSSQQVSSFTLIARGESAALSSSSHTEKGGGGGGEEREECKPATERMSDCKTIVGCTSDCGHRDRELVTETQRHTVNQLQAEYSWRSRTARLRYLLVFFFSFLSLCVSVSSLNCRIALFTQWSI